MFGFHKLVGLGPFVKLYKRKSATQWKLEREPAGYGQKKGKSRDVYAKVEQVIVKKKQMIIKHALVGSEQFQHCMVNLQEQ